MLNLISIHSRRTPPLLLKTSFLLDQGEFPLELGYLFITSFALSLECLDTVR
jgi:hypothetical protein